MRKILSLYLMMCLIPLLGFGQLKNSENSQNANSKFYWKNLQHSGKVNLNPFQFINGTDGINAYCLPAIDCTDGDVITNVTFEGIVNNSGCSASGYTDYTATVAPAEVDAGESYTIFVTVGSGWSFETVGVWIDFDNNESFGDDEFYLIGTGSGSVVSNSIEIPELTATGSYRMRVSVYASDQPMDDPCYIEPLDYGEFEDYLVNVTAVGSADPCDEKTIMECGETYTFELVPDAGQWVNYTDVTWDYTGSEKVWEFTAPATGDYTFDVDEGTEDADFFLMDACSNTATNLSDGYWTGSDSETVTLTEGVTYYLIADLYESETEPTTVTVKVNCPDTEEPGEGCEWTVRVWEDYFGDEVSWELRDLDGVVILSGGGYEESSYDDTQTATATGPLEFYIEAIGTWGDNEPSYTVSNGTEILVSGQLTMDGPGEATYSDLNCEEGGASGPCDEKTIMECGETYTFELVPDAGQWVNYTDVTWDYTGSEKVWEFTAPATGDYTFDVDEGTEDADFFLMDACSNTATNLSDGYWTGSDSETVTLTEGVTYYLIADLYESETEPTTVTVKVNCPDGPPPTGDECEQGVASQSTVPQAFGILTSNPYRSAEDFTVEEGGFTLQKITIDTNQQSVPNAATIYIKGDVGGVPGAILHTITGAPDDSEVVGSAFGDPIIQLTFNLDTEIELPEGTYWLEPNMSTAISGEVVWWAADNYDSSHGANIQRSTDNGNTWTPDTDYSGVFTVSGICGGDEPPPTGDECEQGIASLSEVPNAYNILTTSTFRSAEDFVVDPDGFTLETITIDTNQQGIPNEATILIRADVGGVPGEVLHTITGAPDDSEVVGSAFGDPIYHLTFELDTPIELAEGTYWLDPKMSTATSGEVVWWAVADYDSSSHGAAIQQSTDNGTTWAENPAFSGIFTVSGICGSSEPGDGCEWTVSVFGSGLGDEVSWEFRDADGSVLLSGGPYDDIPFSDTQTITAQDPVEFYIETMGDWSDNTPSFTISNENGIVLSGTVAGGTENTYSNILCSDLPPPPPADCEDHEVLDNGMENAYFLTNSLAVDIPVNDAGFTVEGAYITVAGEATSFNFIFYEDNGGVPGAQFGTATGSIIGSEVIGQNFGYDFIKYNVDFNAGVALNPNTTYWMQVQSDAVAWDWTSDSSAAIGLAGMIDNGSGWASAEGGEFVYQLYCEEMGVSDMNSFDFAYYPNPVKDMLNIESKKAVERIDAFNLAGQKVMSNMKLTQGKVNLSSLTPGMYVFRVMLEGGQVETFKVIKK